MRLKSISLALCFVNALPHSKLNCNTRSIHNAKWQSRGSRLRRTTLSNARRGVAEYRWRMLRLMWSQWECSVITVSATIRKLSSSRVSLWKLVPNWFSLVVVGRVEASTRCPSSVRWVLWSANGNQCHRFSGVGLHQVRISVAKYSDRNRPNEFGHSLFYPH